MRHLPRDLIRHTRCHGYYRGCCREKRTRRGAPQSVQAFGCRDQTGEKILKNLIQGEILMSYIKIKRLALENFKCHRNLVLDFNGGNASIYGDNATGKTSVYDA
ncbi:MAG: hypothetical protein E7577_08050, partial [Ruminococcaceae bacterium]|nr:hypothetical protein [Oscillospiraceae bacterium]